MTAYKNPADADPVSIARDFCLVLGEWLSADELAKVIALNAAEQNVGVCHSHDFCDANEAMIEAFVRNEVGAQFDPADDSHCAIWNRAWDIAKTAKFNASEVRS